MHFGDIVRNLLEERDITQRQLAERLNIAASTLGNYIRNVREPDFETLKKFAAFFHVSTDYLLDYRPAAEAARGEEELLRVYRSLPPEQRELLIEQGKLLHRMNRKKEEKKSSASGILA